jgi:hypothetical protein
MNTIAVQQVIDPAPVPLRGADPTRAAVARYGAAFWWIAFVFVTGMAFSTVPTPLYPLYQVRDGFSTFTITIVFPAYTVGVLTSLLLAGHLSDLVAAGRSYSRRWGLSWPRPCCSSPSPHWRCCSWPG